MLTKEELRKKLSWAKAVFFQFKQETKDAGLLESELVAFANAVGGFYDSGC